MAALLFLTAPAAQAGQERLAGNWLIQFFDNGDLLSFWMVKVDAKAKGTLEVVPDFPESKLKDFKAAGDTLSFTIQFQNRPIDFTFKVPKGEIKKLFGTMTFQGQPYAVQLLPSKLESLKDHKPQAQLPYPKGTFKEVRDQIAKGQDDLGVFEAAEVLIGEADKEKVSATDLKAALEPALQAAKQYGDTWYQEVAAVMARKMAAREAYAAMAETMIRGSLQALGAEVTAEKEMRLLAVLVTSLAKQGKKDDVAKVKARIDTLEIKGHEENEKAGLGFTPEKLKERKGNRVVLVELFTGASCPPCVGADLAFEGLGKTYATSEVVLLQYHLHIPRPDPLTNPDSVARAEYYGDKVGGTPTVFFNGKPDNLGGGGKPQAEGLYKEYRRMIDPELAGTTKLKLTASASRGGDKVALEAKVDGVAKPGDKLRLRFALVEPWVRYPGPNGLIYHTHVVRAMPGGPKGIAVTKASQEEKLTVDLDEVRQAMNKHLDKYGDLEGVRPFSFRNLHLVAFLQDDATSEVLHAIEVPVVTFKEQ
jgi:hypothetical protein